jgi:quinol-cytochrome oxidoreductase complex cytochrome b subunit
MNVWNEYPRWFVGMIWMIVAIGFYLHLLWLDESKLSPDERVPEEWKPIMAVFWFIVIPMRLLGYLADGVGWLRTKLKRS